MKIISEITVRVKKGNFPVLIEDVHRLNCIVQKVSLVESAGDRELYVLEVIYKNRDSFNELLHGSGKKYKVDKVSNVLEQKVRGGLLDVRSKIDFNNMHEYQVNLLGASELINEKIRESEGLDFSGISRSIAIVSGIKSDHDNFQDVLLKMHVRSELDSAVVNRFAGLNAYPLVLEYTQQEDFLKTLQRMEKSFAALRIVQIDGSDINLYEQISSEISIPVVSIETDDIPLYLLTMILKMFKKNKINPGDSTIGIIGIDVSAIRLTRLLVKLGCMRVLGYDFNEKALLSFEHMEGLATTTENIFSNADVVILLKGNFDSEEYQKIRPGQMVISLLDESLHDWEIITSRGVREFVSLNRMDLLVMAPGLIKGVLESGVRTIDDLMMIGFCRKLVNVIHEDYTMPDVFSDIHSMISDLISLDVV